MILYAKFGQHQPLNRQSDVYAREGIELDVSTLADWVGACSATLAPLVELIRRQVLAADRIHGDDTTVPVLARRCAISSLCIVSSAACAGSRRRPTVSGFGRNALQRRMAPSAAANPSPDVQAANQDSFARSL
jgi:hypothetical protein